MTFSFRYTLLIIALCLPDVLFALEQPTSIPGKYLITDQHFPPLSSIIQRSTPAFPVYGIYSWMGEYKRLRSEIKKVGWKTVRISGPLTDADLKILYDDTINFTFMMPNPGKRDTFDSDEAYITASTDLAKVFLDRYGKGGSFYKEYPQYQGRFIPFLQLRNEPNFQYMFTSGSEAQRQALYAKLAPKLAELIKTKSPNTKVIGFTAGGAGAGDLRFVKSVLDIDPRTITGVDAFSTHPYVNPVAPETNNVRSWGSYSIATSLDKLRAMFGKHKRQDIPVWYTEGGWIISKKDGAAYDKPADQVVSKELQAAYSCRYYALALRLGVDCVTNMFITDTDGYPGGFFDRVRKDAWRPSAMAVQTMIRLMPHPALKGAQADGEKGTYIYEFNSHALKKNSPTVIMAYRIEAPQNVTIKVPYKEALVTDMLGGNQKITAIDGSITCRLGALPVYIQENK